MVKTQTATIEQTAFRKSRKKVCTYSLPRFTGKGQGWGTDLPIQNYMDIGKYRKGSEILAVTSIPSSFRGGDGRGGFLLTA